MLASRRVVVTGLGAITPVGNSMTETWAALLDGKSGIVSLEEALTYHQGLSTANMEEEWSIAKTLPCQVVAPVKGWNPPEGDQRTTPRFVRMALEAASQAMADSQLLDWMKLNQDNSMLEERIGVSIGSGMSSVREITQAVHLIDQTKGVRKLSPHFVPKVLSNSAAGRVSLEFGLRGPNLAPSTACAAGSHAIGDALRCIQFGSADVMLAGGTEAAIDPISLGGFSRLRALSTGFNGEPSAASRPFDRHRDGFVMGEGAAILILEELEHAKQRKAPILCELAGYGLSGDAFHITAPDEKGRGAARAMEMAMSQAGMTPESHSIGYVNAHATSTPKGDEIEALVIDRVLCRNGKPNHSLFVSSTKGSTGHLLGAAGALEAAVTVKALESRKVPPTCNLDAMDESLQGKVGFEHPSASRSRQGTLKTLGEDATSALNNSFGFGGTNASLLFRKFQL